MPTGTVKSWIAPRSFGFIRADGGGNADVFFHITSYDGDEPQVGEAVFFEIATDEKSGRLRAVNVRPA